MSAKDQAIQLRKQGYSYNYIAVQTGLSKGTLSYHLRDVPYKANTETVKRIGTARIKSAETKASNKHSTFVHARELAKADIGRVTKRDLFLLGLGLYIGEGSKTQDIIRVVNCDYKVINLFVKWLCSMGFTLQNFTVRLHLYPDSNIYEAEQYWSARTGIPQKQFQRACIDRRSKKDRKRSGTHQHGTAHVTVRSNGNKELGVLFSRRIGAWMEEVLE